MIIGLIPARSGSKGIPQKNIKKLGGYPLMAWSIAAARMSNAIKFVLVSSDSDELGSIAEFYGASFIKRPPEISGDTSTDKEYIYHFLTKVDARLIVLLRPTTPLRDPSIIDLAVKTLIHNSEYSSLRSIHEDSETAFKHMMLKGGTLTPLFPQDKCDFHTQPRQLLPKTYTANGYVDIIKTPLGETLYGSKIFGFISPNAGELDSLDDWDFIEWKLEGNPVYEYLKQTHPL